MDWFILASKSPPPPVVLAVYLLFWFGASAALFLAGIQAYLKKKKMAGIPTIKVNAAAVGLVELSGKAKQLEKITSPISGKPCAFYRITLEKLIRGKHSHWVEMTHARLESGPFALEDESGSIVIDPKGAEVTFKKDSIQRGSKQTFPEHVQKYIQDALDNPAMRDMKYFSLSIFPDEFRITEHLVEEGDQVYVLGPAKIPEKPLPPGLTSDLIVCKAENEDFIVSDESEKSVSGRFTVSMVLGAIGAIGMVLLVAFAFASGEAVLSWVSLLLVLAVFASPFIFRSKLEKLGLFGKPKNP